MGDRKQNPTTTAMHTEVGNMGVNTSKNTEKTIQGPITIELANLCTQVQVITNIIPIPCPRVCLNHSSRYMLLSNLATRSCILRIPHAPSALPISISRTVTRLYHAGVDLCRRSRSHRHSMDFLGGSVHVGSTVLLTKILGMHHYNYGTNCGPLPTPFPTFIHYSALRGWLTHPVCSF